MTDMIATPEDYIIANRYEWLHHVVFEDEAMLANLAIPPDECMRTDIRSWLVSLVLGGLVEAGPKLISLCVNIGGEEAVVTRGVYVLQVLKSQDRKTKK